MADRTVDPIIVPFSVTTPAGTLQTAPLFTALPMRLGRLSNVEIQIPPGHAGTTGIRVEVAQQQIIPYSQVPSWVLGDDYVHDFECNFQVDQGVRVATYNEGNFDHTHYLRLTIWRVAALTVATPVQLHSVQGLSA